MKGSFNHSQHAAARISPRHRGLQPAAGLENSLPWRTQRSSSASTGSEVFGCFELQGDATGTVAGDETGQEIYEDNKTDSKMMSEFTRHP